MIESKLTFFKMQVINLVAPVATDAVGDDKGKEEKDDDKGDRKRKEEIVFLSTIVK